MRMQPDGSGMSERLARAWKSLSLCPIDDTVGESPHAAMRHIGLKTRAASWPWLASSARLKHNLRGYKYMVRHVRPETSTEWMWQRWASVLQVSNGKKYERNKRLLRREIEARVYTMRQFGNFEVRALPGDNVSEGDEPGDDGDDGKPAEEPDDPAPAGQEGWARLLRDFYQSAVFQIHRCILLAH